MATLYKERPGGAFISTALLSLWQHRRRVVLNIWAVSILLVGIATWAWSQHDRHRPRHPLDVVECE